MYLFLPQQCLNSFCKKVKKIIQYVEREGFHVVEMCECEFNRLCQQNTTLYDKLDTKRPDLFLEACL